MMVRCSKVTIVQLLALLAVLGFLNFYYTSTSVEEDEPSERKKFRSIDNVDLPAAVGTQKETQKETAQKETLSPTEEAYRITTRGDVSHGPESNKMHDLIKMENELLLKEQQESKEAEEEEKEQKRLKEVEEQEQNRLKLEKEQRRLQEIEEEKKKEQQRLKEIEEEKEQQRLKEVEEAKKREELENAKKGQEQKDKLDAPKSVEMRIKERMQRIKDVCKRLNYPNSDQYNMYHFRKYGKQGISWCPTFKASSSTWRDFFIDNVLGQHANFMGVHYHLGVLGNSILQRSSNRGSNTKRRRTFYSESDESVRFTVVRHPISRLISHLRKAQNYPYEVKAQRGDWVEECVLSRTDPAWDSATKDKFRQEWNRYLSEIGSNSKHAPFSDDNPYLHPPYPVFPELINFVMKHKNHDDKGNNGHWRPTLEWCDLCQNDLDVIIQLEEEPEELMYLLEKLGMMDYKDKFLSKHNSSSNKSASKNEIEQYVKQLNKEQISYLNKLYAADFEMLGYDPIVV